MHSCVKKRSLWNTPFHYTFPIFRKDNFLHQIHKPRIIHTFSSILCWIYSPKNISDTFFRRCRLCLNTGRRMLNISSLFLTLFLIWMIHSVKSLVLIPIPLLNFLLWTLTLSGISCTLLHLTDKHRPNRQKLYAQWYLWQYYASDTMSHDANICLSLQHILFLTMQTARETAKYLPWDMPYLCSLSPQIIHDKALRLRHFIYNIFSHIFHPFN